MNRQSQNSGNFSRRVCYTKTSELKSGKGQKKFCSAYEEVKLGKVGGVVVSGEGLGFGGDGGGGGAQIGEVREELRRRLSRRLPQTRSQHSALASRFTSTPHSALVIRHILEPER